MIQFARPIPPLSPRTAACSGYLRDRCGRSGTPPKSRRASIPTDFVAASLDQSLRCGSNKGMPAQKISVFLADDNLIVREGVRALIGTAADMAYLLKDRVADGDQLFRAIREVTTGGSMLDSRIVEALVRPASLGTDLSSDEEELLKMLAEGKPIKAIAVARRTTPADVDE